MMKKSVLLSALALVALGSPVAAQDTAVPSNEAERSANGLPADASEESKMICKKQEVTGSLARTRKVCRTKAEWNRISQDMRSQVNDYIDHGRGGSRGN